MYIRQPTRMHAVLAVLLASCLLAAPASSNASVAEENAALDYLKSSFSTVDINRISRISQEMSLDERTAKKFWPQYQAYLHQQIALRDKQLATLSHYAARLHNDSLDQQAAANMLRASMADEAKRVANRQALINRLKDVLSPKQQMRLYQIELLLDAELRAGLLKQIPLAE
jgi:hypothetical protein